MMNLERGPILCTTSCCDELAFLVSDVATVSEAEDSNQAPPGYYTTGSQQNATQGVPMATPNLGQHPQVNTIAAGCYQGNVTSAFGGYPGSGVTQVYGNHGYNVMGAMATATTAPAAAAGNIYPSNPITGAGYLGHNQNAFAPAHNLRLNIDAARNSPRPVDWNRPPEKGAKICTPSENPEALRPLLDVVDSLLSDVNSAGRAQTGNTPGSRLVHSGIATTERPNAGVMTNPGFPMQSSPHGGNYPQASAAMPSQNLLWQIPAPNAVANFRGPPPILVNSGATLSQGPFSSSASAAFSHTAPTSASSATAHSGAQSTLPSANYSGVNQGYAITNPAFTEPVKQSNLGWDRTTVTSSPLITKMPVSGAGPVNPWFADTRIGVPAATNPTPLGDSTDRTSLPVETRGSNPDPSGYTSGTTHLAGEVRGATALDPGGSGVGRAPLPVEGAEVRRDGPPSCGDVGVPPPVRPASQPGITSAVVPAGPASRGVTAPAPARPASQPGETMTSVARPPSLPGGMTVGPPALPPSQPGVTSAVPPARPSSQPGSTPVAPAVPASQPGVTPAGAPVRPSSQPREVTSVPAGGPTYQPGALTAVPAGGPTYQPGAMTAVPAGEPTSQPGEMTAVARVLPASEPGAVTSRPPRKDAVSAPSAQSVGISPTLSLPDLGQVRIQRALLQRGTSRVESCILHSDNWMFSCVLCEHYHYHPPGAPPLLHC